MVSPPFGLRDPRIRIVRAYCIPHRQSGCQNGGMDWLLVKQVPLLRLNVHHFPPPIIRSRKASKSKRGSKSTNQPILLLLLRSFFLVPLLRRGSENSEWPWFLD